MARRKPLVPELEPRPARGSPEETRERIVRAAAKLFNTVGYDGTDSNRIAREAGYSPGTFYKHFADKRAVFLVVYEQWVTREWREIAGAVEARGTAHERASAIVDMFVEHHRRWRGFRASLRMLVSTDHDVRDFYRAQRRRQLELLDRIRLAGRRAHSRESDALLLFALERSADAMADGETRALELDALDFRALLVDVVRARLGSR